MPKVSVCVPAYGNPEGTRRLLMSVAEQNFTDYEVIVTDDSADDAVETAVRDAGTANLYYCRNRTRLGAAANWNEAVRRASGAYIKMMHHDDWFASKDSLGRLAALLDDSPEAALAFCGSYQVTLQEGEEAVRGERFARGISREQEALLRKDWRNLFLGNYIGAPSATIYRKNALEFEEKLTWVMDMEYYMRLLREHPVFSCTQEPLVCIGVSQNQLTESCRTDGKLNLFEYGFLYREFDLGKQKRYQDRLSEVALEFGLPWKELAPYGIEKKSYRKLLRQKKRADFVFLLGVARRKLLRGRTGK